MSEIIESTVSETASNLEPEQRILAIKVEQARSNLLYSLLENRRVAHFIAGKLITALRNGADCSDIILLKNCDSYKVLLQMFMASYNQPVSALELELDHAVDAMIAPGHNHAVQNSHSVQLQAAESAELTEMSDEVHEMLRSMHFLPVFLVDMAESLENHRLVVDKLDPVYQATLRRHRTELKLRRQQMISANTGLVAFVAHKYRTNTLSFEDLMQEGLVGLIKAVDRFDPERGICFSTYAIYWIKQAISRLIVKQDKIVPLPVALAEKSSAVFEAMRVSYIQNERWPTIKELKQCCDLSEQELKLISSYYQATHSLDTSSDEDDGMDTMANMQQSQFAHPLDQLIEGDLAQYVDKAVATLPEKQATILTMRFGLKNHTEMTLQAVADQLHVTRERVRQIQNEALQRLKQQFGFDLMLFLEPNDS